MPIGCEEGAVGLAQGDSSPPRCRVSERGGTLLETIGLVPRILAHHDGQPERGPPRASRVNSSLALDLLDELPHEAPSTGFGQVLPAGQRREPRGFDCGERLGVEPKASSRRRVLERAVDPSAGERSILEQGPGAMGAGPFERRSDQAFLDTMGEEIAKASDLGFRLFGYEDGLVPAPPELLAPADEPPSLPGEVGVEVAHEARQPLRALDGYQQMEVVGEKGERVELDRIKAHRARQDAQRQVAENGRRPQEQPPLHGAASDFDERSGWDEAQSAGHAYPRRELECLPFTIRLAPTATRPAATFDGEDLYPDDAAKAAALLHSLVTGHPFADGNKRTGAVAAELFLAINGWTLVESEEALYSVVLRVARGELASEALAIWIRQRLTPAEE